MKIYRFLILSLGSGISMMAVAGIWHELLLKQFYETATHASHEGTGVIFIAYIILGMFMAGLYPQQVSNRQDLANGFKFGAIIGLLWVFPHGLAMAGAHGDSIGYVFKNSAWHMIEQGLGGLVIAAIYKWLDRKKIEAPSGQGM